MKYFGEEIFGTLGLRIGKEGLFIGILDNLPFIHKDHPVRHLAGKAHLMGHDHHGHPFVGQFDHNVQHLVNHLRVKR